MGLIWHVPGFSKYENDTRYGDCQFFIYTYPKTGHKLFFAIDGYDKDGDDRFIEDLYLFKANKDSEIWVEISHGHYDHLKGIRTAINHKTNGKYTFNITRLYMQDPASLKVGLRDNKGSGYVRNAINTLYEIKAEAEARGIKVIFVKNKQKIKFGDTTIQFFREQPTRVEDSDRYGDTYLNHGSIITWFPDLSYITSGDGPKRLDQICDKYDLDPIFVKGPHHGNILIRVCATWLKNHGCLYYWDNDLSKDITGFLETGREDAIAVGMEILNCVGDINGVAHNGKLYVYKNGKLAFSYDCSYKGPKTLIQKPTVTLVRMILRGKYSTGDRRISKILAIGYAPLEAQKYVDRVINTAKGILSGRLDYGQNKERIKKINEVFGGNYGQLVQDYINVLAGGKENV